MQPRRHMNSAAASCIESDPVTGMPVTGLEGQDVATLIDHRAASRGDHPFLIWEPFEGAGERWSYADLGAKARRFAAGLQARGVAVGDAILIHLDNRPEFLLAWLGCAYAGAVGVTTNTRSAGDEIAYYAGHARVVGAVTERAYAEAVRAALPADTWMTVVDGGDCDAASASVEGDDWVPRSPDPDARFGIQYTSGTTARPKAVVWSHANALWGARLSAQHEGLTPDDVHLVHLPLFHTNAQVYSVLASLWAGATVVLQPRFSASRFWPVSLCHGCTWTSMVPFCVRALVDRPVPAGHRYRNFGYPVCDPPTDAVLGVKSVGWWGMTETVTHGVVGSPAEPDSPMSMGRPSPGYGILVLDDKRRPVAPGEVGDLYVRGLRGVSLFVEYLDDPSSTAAAFTDDGLLITGDRVLLEADGSLFFVERAKDMLKVGGENVAASEIERVIATVAGVSEVAVVARRHPMLDEVPVAFVIPLDADDATLADRIGTACATALADFKRPAEVRLVDALPRAPLNKVSKAALREMLGGSGNETKLVMEDG